MLNENEFIKDLNEAIANMEAEELDVKMTGDEDTDRELIQNPQQADYFCKVIKELREERDKVNELINQELERVNKHYEMYRTQHLNKIDGQINYFSRMLESYATKELQEEIINMAKEIIDKQNANLEKYRKEVSVLWQDKYEYDDEQILKWLKHNKQDKYIKVKTEETVDKKNLKKEGFAHNGKLYIDDVPVEGVVVTKQPDKFEVK